MSFLRFVDPSTGRLVPANTQGNDGKDKTPQNKKSKAAKVAESALHTPSASPSSSTALTAVKATPRSALSPGVGPAATGSNQQNSFLAWDSAMSEYHVGNVPDLHSTAVWVTSPPPSTLTQLPSIDQALVYEDIKPDSLAVPFWHYGTATFPQVLPLQVSYSEALLKARKTKLAEKMGWDESKKNMPMRLAIQLKFFQLFQVLSHAKELTQRGKFYFLGMINHFDAFPFHQEMSRYLEVFEKDPDLCVPKAMKRDEVAETLRLLTPFCSDRTFAMTTVECLIQSPQLNHTPNPEAALVIVDEAKHLVISLGNEVIPELLQLKVEAEIIYKSMRHLRHTPSGFSRDNLLKHLTSFNRIFFLRKQSLLNQLRLWSHYFKSQQFSLLPQVTKKIQYSTGLLASTLNQVMTEIIKLMDYMAVHISKQDYEQIDKDEFFSTYSSRPLLRELFQAKSKMVHEAYCKVLGLHNEYVDDLVKDVDQTMTKMLVRKKMVLRLCLEKETEINFEDVKKRAAEEKEMAGKLQSYRAEALQIRLLDSKSTKVEATFRGLVQMKARYQTLRSSFNCINKNLYEMNDSIGLYLLSKGFFSDTQTSLEEECQSIDEETRFELEPVRDDHKTKSEPPNIDIKEDLSNEVATATPEVDTSTKPVVDGSSDLQVVPAMRQIVPFCVAVEKLGMKTGQLALKETSYHVRILASMMDLLEKLSPNTTQDEKGPKLGADIIGPLAFSMVRCTSIATEQLLTALNLNTGAEILTLPHSHKKLEKPLDLISTFPGNFKGPMREYLHHINGGSVFHRYRLECFAGGKASTSQDPPQWLAGTKAFSADDLKALGQQTFTFIDLAAQPANKPDFKVLKFVPTEKTRTKIGERQKALQGYATTISKDLDKMALVVTSKIVMLKDRPQPVDGNGADIVCWETARDHIQGLKGALNLWTLAPETRYLALCGEAIWARMQLIDELIGKAFHWEMYGQPYTGHRLEELRDLTVWVGSDEEKASVSKLNVGGGLQLIHHHLNKYKQMGKTAPRSLTWREEALQASLYGDDFDEGFSPQTIKVSPPNLRAELIDIVKEFCSVSLARLALDIQKKGSTKEKPEAVITGQDHKTRKGR